MTHGFDPIECDHLQYGRVLGLGFETPAELLPIHVRES
jgi:hypothetical protein